MSASLDQLRAVLAAPDAVMEPGVLVAIQQFVQERGTPVEIVQLLSDGYQGQAEMCNLLVQWLRLISDDSPGMTPVRDFVEGNLRTVLMERFDPRKADQNLLEQSEASMLEWLRPMIDRPNYRTMIYKLSQEHETCVLLNFAIQTICDAGYQKEIAGIATASKYVHVFSRVLVDAVLLLHGEDDLSLTERFQEFARSSTGAPHTYLYAQTLLRRTQKESRAMWLKRLSDELANSILYHFSAGFWGHQRLVDAISSVVEAKSALSEHVTTVYNECQKSPEQTMPVLQQADFIEVLLHDLFDQNRSPPEHLRSKCMWILAAAVSRDVNDVDTTKSTLEKVGNLVLQNPIGFSLQSSMLHIVDLLVQPVVAHALLVWLKNTIKQNDYYHNNWTTAAAIPNHFVLLEEIAVRFPLLRVHVFSIFREEFETPPEAFKTMQLTNFRKMLVDRFLFLTALGWVTPVLRVMLKSVQHVDLAIFTHFFDRLFAIAQLPYSDTMSSLLLQIINLPSISSMLVLHGSLMPPMLAFLEHCQRIETLEPDLRASLPSLTQIFSSANA